MPPGSSARKSSGKTRVCSDEFIEDDESAPPSDEEYSDESVHCFFFIQAIQLTDNTLYLSSAMTKMKNTPMTMITGLLLFPYNTEHQF